MPPDETHQEGLPDRNVHPTDDTGYRRKRHEVPYLDGAGQHQSGEHHGLQHGRDLGHDYHAVATPAIAQGSRERSDEEDRELVREGDEPEHQRGPCQFVDEPADRHVLHPAAHQRNPLPGEEEAQVAVAEGSEGDTEAFEHA